MECEIETAIYVLDNLKRDIIITLPTLVNSHFYITFLLKWEKNLHYYEHSIYIFLLN